MSRPEHTVSSPAVVRQLGALLDQLDSGIAFAERLSASALRISPTVLQLLDSYVLQRIVTGVEQLAAFGVRSDGLDNAKHNLAHSAKQLPTQPLDQALPWILIFLSCLRAEVAELLADKEAPIAASVELAFAHLQRSLVVDDSLRSRWRAAWMKNETTCERLGGVHLLQHGLWGFKTDSTGERSDLVLGEPVLDIERSALLASRGLILTEWKRARARQAHTSIDKLAKQARSQLAAYSGGHLVGVELRRVRYVVIVSEHEVAIAPEVTVQDFVVRQINIAVDPQSPSKRSKRSKS